MDINYQQYSDITPSGEELPNYESDSAPLADNGYVPQALDNQFQPKELEENMNINNEGQKGEDKTELNEISQQKVFNPHKKSSVINTYNLKRKLKFAIILLIITIIDIAMQIHWEYTNFLTGGDDAGILILLIYFFYNYCARHKIQITNIFGSIFFLIIWLGGAVCKFLGIIFINDAKIETQYRIIIFVIYLPSIVIRIYSLMTIFATE